MQNTKSYTVANTRTSLEVSQRVHWIGALDPQLRTFDIILSTANGTTYNSYLVRGSEGVAIIDTVKEEFSDEFFARLESVARYDEIKVIILNHLEPDHTGALPELLNRAPHARLYISYRAQAMLKALLKQEDEKIDFTPVDTGDCVSLGDRTLRFLNAPYLHWPDTQFTFLEEEQILFSGDAFGCHFCDGRLFNDVVGDFRFSFEYYYAHIMRPFRNYVLEAIEKVELLQINIVAPTHGPILRRKPQRYIQRYKELSTPHLNYDLDENEKTLLIFYISSYGNTAQMAKAVQAGANEVENMNVSLYDLAGGEVEPFVDLIEEADGVALGTPTINGDAAKPIWDLLSSLVVVSLRGKVGAAFGSYGWTGEAVPMIEDRLRGLKMRVPVKGLRIKLIPTERELQQCHDFGRELAEAMVGKQQKRVIDMSELLSG